MVLSVMEEGEVESNVARIYSSTLYELLFCRLALSHL